ncbi:MAG: hypothetical protein K5905_09880 [Roseibium sp.]|uniref:hypothetical protein n=1 Tax=Roseibium sp. TaxID=1936156 RepID=UPI00260EAB89|nr:hypothetical protein [Roseibium sp.]MCV0425773.1 hypothetical protein [Roseibium sp.]
MSEKDQQEQTVEHGREKSPGLKDKPLSKEKGPSREDRLAEALRANLRRRKSAAKTRKDA